MSSSPKALPYFEIDKAGLAAILERRGKGFVVPELIQNSWDEDGVSSVRVEIESLPGKPLARLVVEDDAPEGFSDIAYAYTLFKPSAKVHDTSKRGRFSLGDKLVLSMAEQASIETTKGTVVFDKDGRHHFPRRKRAHGSVFEGTIRMTREDVAEAAQLVQMLLPPPQIALSFNGERIPYREPVAEFETTLATEIADADGNLKPTRRKTLVRVYEPAPGEAAHLYEMGIPVVATGDRFHVSIEQKIPVSLDRTNLITPGYLRDVRTAVLNNTAHLLRENDSDQRWIDDALEDEAISQQAVEQALKLRFGPKFVLRDPSDPEAEKIAVSQGFTIIPSRGLSKQAFKNIRRFEAALPAGRVTPSAKPYSDDPDARVRDELPEERWTTGIRAIARLARDLGVELLGRELTVKMVSDPQVMHFGATFNRSGGILEFNLRKLGYKWFDNGASKDVLSLLIHEFGHNYPGGDDHLSAAYYRALTDLGAKLALLVFHEGFDLDNYTVEAQEQLEASLARSEQLRNG